MDMVMLGFIKTETDVGIYNAVYKIFMVGSLPIGVIMRILLPSLSRISNKEYLLNSLIKYGTMLFVSSVSAAIIIYFFASNILNSIYGEQYSSGQFALMMIAINIAVIGVNVFIGIPLTVWGFQRKYAVAITFGAIANILMNFLLIPKYSYNGAALATLFSEVVVFIGLFYLFSKYSKTIVS